MKFRQFKRSATCAWSPGQHLPLLALGTVAGAVDVNFSSASELEIYDLNFEELQNGNDRINLSNVKKVGSINSSSKFNRIAWGYATQDPQRAYGIIAGGMENGELCFYNATALVENRPQEALLARNTSHKGGVRGLDFNNINKNLLASGAGEGEILIWDMSSPGKPYSPGSRSNKLEDITAISWNRGFASVIATASNNGCTVVWDLRNRSEVLALPHPAGRRMITGLAWNPEEAMQLVTISDDDYNPAVLLWDCRNARAPLKSLNGHNKGILSVAWCPKDSELLITSGKDNRTLCWDVKAGQLIGEVQTSGNWAFDVQWSSRNPDFVAVGSFDRRVTVHSLIGLKNVTFDEGEQPASPMAHQFMSDDNSFSAALQNFHNATLQAQAHSVVSSGEFTLPRPPKWMRRGCSATWGFGGKLIVTSTAKDSSKKSVLSVRVPVIDVDLYNRFKLMDQISKESDPDKLQAYCESIEHVHEKYAADASPERAVIYKHERDYWMTLGALFGKHPRQQLLKMLGFESGKIQVPGVDEMFAKLSLSVPELATPGAAAEAVDSKPTVSRLPFQLYTSPQAAAAATSGSTKPPPADTLLTQAVIVGDYETAVKLCLVQNRMTEALLFATVGDKEQITLVPMVRNFLLKQGRSAKSYLRVLDAAVREDVTDVVDSAELIGGDDQLLWRDLLAFICTYAKADEFSDLCLKLAQRLESKKGGDGSPRDEELGFAASLCYLGANVYDPVVRYWLRFEDMLEQLPAAAASKAGAARVSQQGNQSTALQTLMEKVVLFERLQSPGDGSSSDLSDVAPEEMYGKYIEYAGALCNNGRVDIAIRFLARVPEAYAEQLEPGRFRAFLELKFRCWHAAGPLSYNYFQQEPSKPFTVSDIVQVQHVAADPDNQPLWNQYSKGQGYSQYPQAPQAQPAYNQYGRYGAPQAQSFAPNPSPQIAPPATDYSVSGDKYAASYSANSQLSDRYQQYAPPASAQGVPPSFSAPPPHIATSNSAIPPPRQAVGGSLAVPGPGPIVSNPGANGVMSSMPQMGGQQFGFPQAPAYMAAGSIAPPLAPGPPSSMTVPPKHGFNDAPDLTPDVSRLLPKNKPPALPQAPVSPYGGNRQNSVTTTSPVYYSNNPLAGSVPGAPISGAYGAPAPGPVQPPPQPQAPPQPVAPPKPEVKRFPAGDRSHISPADMPIVTLLSKALEEWRRGCSPQQKRAFDDTERKLGVLFDQLNNSEVSAPVASLLLGIAKALEARQFQVALQSIVVMLTTHSQSVSSWGNGVRRLSESLQSLSFNRPM